MKLIFILLAWVIVFPLLGLTLESLGLESNAYFAFYGAVFALCFNAINIVGE